MFRKLKKGKAQKPKEPDTPLNIKEMREVHGAFWFELSGAKKKQEHTSKHEDFVLDYDEYIMAQAISNFDEVRLEQFKTIRKDVDAGRTDATIFRSQPDMERLITQCQIAKFGAKDYVKDSRGEITRVLQAYVQRNRHPGYVQGMNYVVCFLLCFMTEEQSFWTLCSIVEDMRLPDFYSTSVSSMHGFLVEMDVLQAMAKRLQRKQHLPMLSQVLEPEQLGMMINLFASHSLIPMFVVSMPVEAVLVAWQCFFGDGGELALARVFMALLGICDQRIAENGLDGMDGQQQQERENGIVDEGAEDDMMGPQLGADPTMQVYQLLKEVTESVTGDALRKSMAQQRTHITTKLWKELLEEVHSNKAVAWVTDPGQHDLLARKLRFRKPDVTRWADVFYHFFMRKKGDPSPLEPNDVVLQPPMIHTQTVNNKRFSFHRLKTQTTPNRLSVPNRTQTMPADKSPRRLFSLSPRSRRSSNNKSSPNSRSTSRTRSEYATSPSHSKRKTWTQKSQPSSPARGLNGAAPAPGPEEAETMDGMTRRQFRWLCERVHQSREIDLAYSGTDLDSLFDLFDEDKSGYIDYKELLCYLNTVCLGSVDDRLHLCFMVYDQQRIGGLQGLPLERLILNLQQTIRRLKRRAEASRRAQPGYGRSKNDDSNLSSTSSRKSSFEASFETFEELGLEADDSSLDWATDSEVKLLQTSESVLVNSVAQELMELRERGGDGMVTYAEWRDGVRNPKGMIRYLFEQRGAVQGTVPLMEVRGAFDQMNVEGDLRQASFMASDDGL